MMTAPGRKPYAAIASRSQDGPEATDEASLAIAPDCPAGASATKHRRILEAARALFLREGYAAASMDSIAAEAGASKRTVYNHFGSKEALFSAIVRARCDQLLRGMALPAGASDAEDSGAALRHTLTGLARQFLELILLPESLDMHRLLVGEASRLPELGRVFYESGPARAVETLAGYLEDQAPRNPTPGAVDRGLRIEDPRLAAEQFFGMVLGHFQLRALLGVGNSPGPAELDAAVETAVAAFVRAHRR